MQLSLPQVLGFGRIILSIPGTFIDSKLCVSMCIHVCPSVIERYINPSSPTFSVSLSFHPSPFSWAATVDSFNGKFKQTTPPSCLSLHLISYPVPASSVLSLSLYLSFCPAPFSPVKISQSVFFFSLFCSLCRWSIRWKGQREREGGKGRWKGWGGLFLNLLPFSLSIPSPQSPPLFPYCPPVLGQKWWTSILQIRNPSVKWEATELKDPVY